MATTVQTDNSTDTRYTGAQLRRVVYDIDGVRGLGPVKIPWLAEQIGVDRTRIYYLMQQQTYTAAVAERIAYALAIPVSLLAEGDDA